MICSTLNELVATDSQLTDRPNSEGLSIATLGLTNRPRTQLAFYDLPEQKPPTFQTSRYLIRRGPIGKLLEVEATR